MSPDGPMKPLPEEKLLRLIRQKKSDAPPAGSSPSTGLLPVQVINVMGGGGVTLRWPVLAAGGLGMVLAIEAVLLVAQLLRPLPSVQLPVVTGTTAAPEWQTSTVIEQTPSLAQSASQVLFNSTETGTESSAVDERRAVRAEPSASATQLATRLTLMGIVAGDPPQAIIEDTQTHKTYFLTAGQAIAEGAVVEQVSENRVILNFAGEKIELTL